MNFDNVLIDLVRKYSRGMKDNSSNWYDNSSPTGSVVDLNSTQVGPSISEYQKPTVHISVIDFKRISSHFGWVISFKIIEEAHRHYHLDALPTNKALVADNGNWYEFDDDKMGSMVENPTIKQMILDAINVYLRGMNDSFNYIRSISAPKLDFDVVKTPMSHSIMYSSNP